MGLTAICSLWVPEVGTAAEFRIPSSGANAETCFTLNSQEVKGSDVLVYRVTGGRRRRGSLCSRGKCNRKEQK
ncbi:hypothetical protein AV530_003514 [Patagioenas fasciata monilis]|uniref:Uncharacterized protein n=1 Tax=Patagioenas fasciata monilis TaxID=372326 RepID=A0A1V4K311_PATFA|nr:hypothetical protein AV530_003514 [Patagioenas fasciata monilis]